MSSRHKKRKKKSAFRTGAPEPPPIDMERVLSNLHRLLEDKQFRTLDEAQDYMSSMTPEQMYEMVTTESPRTPADEARDLVYKAFEADDQQEALALARRALTLDPDCVDAMLLVNDITAGGDDEHLAGLAKIVDAAARALGPDYFREHEGHFWGMLETRPYMRARFRLAEGLRDSMRTEEALPHFEELLRLNPNDNQGVRDHLLACYLFLFDYRRPNQYLEKARDLMKRYQDHSAVFLWGAVLERILAGDFPGAARAFKRAHNQNRFVEQYLSMARPLNQLPEMYSPGTESEAGYCVSVLGMSWIRQLPAFFYLQGALGEKAGRIPESMFSDDDDEDEDEQR